MGGQPKSCMVEMWALNMTREENAYFTLLIVISLTQGLVRDLVCWQGFINSFQDSLTRQLAESVRIDRRGSNILNSRSEYYRCQVPRLQIDQEVWNLKEKDREKDKSRKENAKKDDDNDSEQPENEAPGITAPKALEEDKDSEEEVRNRIEEASRRLESKRKGTSEGRKT